MTLHTSIVSKERLPAFIFPSENPVFLRLRRVLLAGAAAFCAAGPAPAQSFTDIGTPPGVPAGDEAVEDRVAVSGDGKTLALSALGNGFRRAANGTYTDLGRLHGGNSLSTYGINADGSVIVGQAVDGGVFQPRAARWTADTGLISLGTLGGSTSAATGVSDDGNTVVGSSTLPSGRSRAFRWTQAAGMVDLGVVGLAKWSWANGVSGDGSTVVGYSNDQQDGNISGFRWTQATGMVSLGSLNNGSVSLARAANRDGSVIVGYAADGMLNNSARAFRWTQATGMVSLGTLGGANDTSDARAVSADGAVVVGNTYMPLTPNDEPSAVGFRWTQATGMLSVEKWLRSNGVAVADFTTQTASGVSADGNVVVGQLRNTNPYIARGPVPVQPGGTTTTAGLMDVPNFQQSLANLNGLPPMSLNADQVINGAHSSPLFMLLDAGQSSAWFTGDGGYADAQTYRGGLGAGEIGFGRGIEGGWTVRIAGGGQYSRFDLNNAGNATFSGGYVAPEAALNFGGRFVGTLTGYYSWGRADIRRGYLNGTANDFSTGSTDTQTFALRARLDWKDAFMLADTGVSPYASYTHIDGRMGGYTETGGSFPSRFDASREVSNAVRIGADAKTPLNDQFALVTRLEYGHRFEKAGAGVSGQILGLSAFSIDGAPVQQDWVRGGIGVNYKLGNGDGLVMLNTSNQTGRNVTWLSASYRVKF
ncbi:putative HAF family extracellular repeat protein [Rhizobium aquaticum]|uniref:HAF family extracellular repeat protein n=1 Tax=Rhizobium aquaticum TaxID=1549636 RepID=A0ABV2J4M5_9HYPH